jgi:hypothetical protein
MKRSFFLLAGSILLFNLCGCTSVKRFKTADYKGEDNRLVEVDLFHTRLSTDPVAVKEKNLWTLSANAQTRLIQILDERYPDNEQFMKVLSGSYGTEDIQGEEYTRKDLRMVFTLSKSRDYQVLNDPQSRFSPADRIEYFSLSLEIPDSYRLRFHEWNRYVTEYGEIHIADVSFSRNLDLDFEGNPAGVDMGTGASLGRNEKQEVTKRYLKLNGSISDQHVLIEAEGTREVDLTGNITADVSLQFDAFPEVVQVPVFVAGEKGERVLADLKFLDVLVPGMSEAPDTIFADLKLSYIYRHVDSGWKTFAEWDDRVEYYRGTIKKEVPLFLKKDYLPGFFCIGTGQGGEAAIKLYKSPEREFLLQFRDYREAHVFLEWLENFAQSNSGTVDINGMKLLHKGKPISASEVPENHFRVLPVYL